MAEDHPLVTLTEALLREAAHRQRFAREDKAALLQDVLARAWGPQWQLQDWWQQRTGMADLPLVAFPPDETPARAAPRARATREVVGQHVQAQLYTTDSGETILQVEATDTAWAGTFVLLSWQTHDTSALQQGLILLEQPVPQTPCYGAIRLGRLTEEADIVVAEQPLDVALLHELPVAIVQASVDRAVDRRGWRTWYRQQQGALVPALRQALATALEDA